MVMLLHLLSFHHYPERLFSSSHALLLYSSLRSYLYSYLCHPHLSCWPNFSFFAVSNVQLWVHKGTATDRSSQMSIWGESQGTHLHPSTSVSTVGEPPPASWHHSGSYKWMWHSCSFSHSPLSLLACLPSRDIPWTTVGISHTLCWEDLFSIFNLQPFRDVSVYLCLGYLCLVPGIWLSSVAKMVMSHISILFSQSEEVTVCEYFDSDCGG